MNTSEHINRFNQELKRRNYSSTTIKTYTSCVEVFLNTVHKDHPKNISKSDIVNYLSSTQAINTQKSHHCAIKKFYEICLNQHHKLDNVPYAKPNKKLPIVLSQDEVQKMFDVCDNLKHKVILSLLYSTGIRVSELINLQWKHLDRSRMVINIVQGKGKKDRQVMLVPELIPLLESYYRVYKSTPYVLSGQSLPQYSTRSVGQVIKQLAAKAGLDSKRVYTHLIRHCTFTHMVENGTDVNIVQRVAGHSSVRTTNIYLHLSHNTIAKINSPFSKIKL